MALLFADSFDHYASADLTKKWTSVAVRAPTIVAGRFGNGLQYSATNFSTISDRGATKIFGGTATTLIVGFAFKYASVVSTQGRLIYLGEAAAHHIGFQVNTSGKIELYSYGTSAVVLTSSTILTAGTWYYVEIKMVVADSPSGSVQLRIDAGLTEDQTVSGIDTRAAGTPIIDRIHVGSTGNLADGPTVTYILDDLYILDDVDQSIAQPGSPANDDFLGDIRVQALFPAGNGAHSAWVGSDGNSVDNYQLVDEAAPAIADYVESNVVGDEDTYTYSDLSATAGTVYGVQVLPYAWKSDAGSRQVASVARVSGTEETGPDQTLSTTEQYLPDIRGADPSGAQWTIASVNGAQFGVKVTT